MSVLSFRGLALSAPCGRILIQACDLHLPPGITALVGANGVGKSSLLRVLAGEAEPAAGVVQRRGRWLRVGDGPLAAAEVDACFASLRDGIGAIPELLRPLLPATLATRLPRSGGEQQRLRLLAALAQQPDGLLLDEPAAHLDADARQRLQRWLASARPHCLLVAHDPELLDHADAVLELSGGRLHAYRLGYADYLRQRAAEQADAAASIDRLRREQQRERAQAQQARERAERRAAGGERQRQRGSQGALLLDYRAGRADASHARQQREARRRDAQIASLREAERERLCLSVPLRLDLDGAALAPAQRVLDAAGLGLDGPQGALFDGLDLALQGPQRWLLCGPNGSGKSRLLRLLAGHAAPPRGSLRRFVDDLVLIDQQAALPPGERVLEALLAAQPGLSPARARECLAGFLFAGELAFAPLAGLSSGERLRLALACALSAGRPPRLLLLDEPDNHLDLPSRAVLQAALQAYRGALVVATHSPSLQAALGATGRLQLGVPEPRLERL